tara:strand:- start:4547 stop:4903 length:357 start_codon:yes stop_codon:yes gene_type:complete
MLDNDYFVRSEFECQCGCGFDTVDAQLLVILTAVREHFKSSVIITSGCRCEEHNRKVGGAKKSYHIVAKAADFKVKGVSPSEVMDFLEKTYPNQYGFIEYSSWVHADPRDVAYFKRLQ